MHLPKILKFSDDFLLDFLNVSYLQLLIEKGGMEKSYILDSIITTLKEWYSYDDEKYLIIALTGKAALNICSLLIHLYKEGLSLPTRGKQTDLKGERLDYFQNK